MCARTLVCCSYVRLGDCLEGRGEEQTETDCLRANRKRRARTHTHTLKWSGLTRVDARTHHTVVLGSDEIAKGWSASLAAFKQSLDASRGAVYGRNGVIDGEAGIVATSLCWAS